MPEDTKCESVTWIVFVVVVIYRVLFYNAAVCTIPSKDQHGQPPIVTNGGIAGSMMTVVCNEGYFFTRSQPRTCQPDGRWYEEHGYCKEVHCPRMPEPQNGEIQYLGYGYSAIAEVKCNDHYLFSNPGNNKLTCQGDNSWSTPLGVCKIAQCEKPKIPEQGKIELTNLYPDGTVTISCEEGYAYDGKQKLVCQRNGFWNGKEGTCEEVDCQRNLGIPYGQILFSGSGYNAIAEVKCVEGYAFTRPQENKLICQGDNKWTAIVGTCEAVQCPFMALPPRGRIEYSGRGYRDTAVVRCNHGYIFSDPKLNIQTCQGDNTWSDTVGECEEIHCENPPEIENGKTSSIQDNQYKARITRMCNDGYYVDGSDEITCQANGKWDTKKGDCSSYVDYGIQCLPYVFLLFLLYSMTEVKIKNPLRSLKKWFISQGDCLNKPEPNVPEVRNITDIKYLSLETSTCVLQGSNGNNILTDFKLPDNWPLIAKKIKQELITDEPRLVGAEGIGATGVNSKLKGYLESWEVIENSDLQKIMSNPTPAKQASELVTQLKSCSDEQLVLFARAMMKIGKGHILECLDPTAKAWIGGGEDKFFLKQLKKPV